MSNRPESDQSMPLIAHLIELRKRLLRCIITVLLIFFALFYFSQDIYSLASAPLRAYLPEGAGMIATGVISPFLTPFKLTLVVSLYLAVPVFLFELWGFIAPGLYKHEKRIAMPLLISSIVLFYAGMAFAYFVVFPLVFSFMVGIAPEGATLMPDISQYLDFMLTLFFAFGVAFEVPVATVLLIWVGIVDVSTLKKSRPYVIVGCFVIGMLLTPPDVISQSLLAIPMWLLFEVGLFFGGMVKKTRENPEEASSTEPEKSETKQPTETP